MNQDQLQELAAKFPNGKPEAGKMPIEAVDADQLPRETALQYEELCLIVGSLYIDSHHRVNTMEERHKAIVGELQFRLRETTKEIQRLKETSNAGPRNPQAYDSDSGGASPLPHEQ